MTLPANDCLLTLNIPEALEEALVDLLLENPALASGFTTLNIDGHGPSETTISASDQVRGRRARIQFQIVLARQNSAELLDRVRAQMPSREIFYWIAPLLETGRLL
ncbi:MAG: DUF3240 family protein [Betaproteobacteria bacterium]|nr:DUF3240 family protein [Betaproteobacteria bacterium]